MLGALLLLLVIVNAGLTGWLLSQVKNIKKVIADLGTVVRDHESEMFDRKISSEV